MIQMINIHARVKVESATDFVVVKPPAQLDRVEIVKLYLCFWLEGFQLPQRVRTRVFH